jgi:hypothetical protein
MRYKIFIILLLLSSMARGQEPDANVLRVNPHAGSSAEFSSLQMAVNAWVPGDEIWVETVCSGPWIGCSSAFENVVINKPVIIRGPGYFLGINNIYADLNDTGAFGFIQLIGGSEGCVIAGLTVSQLIVTASFTTIERCRISSLECFSSNNFIQQNYIQSNFTGIPALRFGGFSNTIKNNFIGSDDLSAPTELNIEQIGSFPNLFESNTVVGGLSSFQGSTIFENIFYNHVFQNIDNNLISFNLFNQAEPALSSDLGGETNDLCQIFCDPSNQINLTSEYFVGGSGDTQWIPLDSAPTFIASDGTSVGMYDQSPTSYRKSGLSIDPIISQLEINACVKEGFQLLPVNLVASSGSETPVLYAEYFLDVDPGVGNGTPLQFADALLGNLFFTANLDGLAPGVHLLGIRIIDVIDNFSFTQERSFTIKTNPEVANIIGYEYLVDIDDGYGSGIQVLNVAPATIADFNTLINSAALTEGFHQIQFRAIDADGSYGVTQIKTVFILPPNEQGGTDEPETNTVSFFTGEDPGIDLSPEFPVSNTDDFGTFLDLMFDEAGIQDVQIRVKDNFGNWSTTQVRTFYVLPEEQPTPDLDRLEYYIDNDPGYNDSPNFSLPPGTTFEGLFTIPLLNVSGGYHHIFFRTRDVSGDFSTTQGKLVFVMDEGFMIADINSDGVVNITDLLILVSNYGCSDGACIADQTGDGIVTISDLLAFIQYFGQPGPPPIGPQ